MRYRASLFVFLLTAVAPSLPTLASGESTATMQIPVAMGKGGSAGSQTGKNANGTYTLKSSTRLVVLDVIVRDARGNVVTGLTKDDFKVMEATQPQTVLNFVAAGAHVVSPDVMIHSSTELDEVAPDAPVNIILLDEFNTLYERMAYGRYELKKYLETQPDRLATPTMLLAAGMKAGVSTFTVLSDYTQDKGALLSVLEHRFPPYPWQSESMGIDLNFSQINERLGTAFGTLERVAKAAEGHPGHKNLIWIGNGFPDIIMGGPDNPIPESMWNAIDQCEKDLRMARVTLYSIDPSGVTGANPGNLWQLKREFRNLAEDTGGKAYTYNDLDVAIGSYTREGAEFYTLSYRPTTDSMNEQKFRKIVVTVDRPGLIATTSTGYYERPKQDFLGLKNPKTRRNFDLVTTENSTIAYHGVMVSVAQSPDDQYSFMVNVPTSDLAWTTVAGATQSHANAIVMASTFDRKGKELKRFATNVEVHEPTRVTANGTVLSGMVLPVKLAHDPKAVRVRFVVRVDGTEQVGTADFVLQP